LDTRLFLVALIMFVGFCPINLYAQGTYAVDEDSYLYALDLDNCQSTLIGYTGHSFDDIAINPVDKKLYGISLSELYQIDTLTANSTYIGFGAYQFTALTFSDTGALYGMRATSDHLYSISTTNGWSHSIGSTGTGIGSAGDLTFYGEDLYLSGTGDTLVKIDLSNLSNSTVIGGFQNVSNVFGITTIGCSPEMYTFSYNNIHIIQQNNLLSPQLFCQNIIQGKFSGATSLNETTPPSTLEFGPDTALCENDTILLSAYRAGATYVWQDGSTQSEYWVKDPGTYAVTVTKDGCSWTDSLDVSYIAPEYYSLGNDTTLCGDEVLELDVSVSGNADYIWQDGSSGSVKEITSAGVYWVNVMGSRCSWSDTLVVNFLENPQELIADTILCPDDSITLVAYHPDAISYLWQDGSTNSSLTAVSEGSYWVDVKYGQCHWSDTVEVSKLPKTMMRDASSPLRDTVICKYSDLEINLSMPNTDFYWQDGTSNGNYVITEPGFYWVDVQNKCTYFTDSFYVDVEDCVCKVHAPDAFTPNGDGLNDEFQVKYDCNFDAYSLKIFNRWGQRIFFAPTPYLHWNGTFEGVNSPIGAYVFLVEYVYKGQTYTKKGKISLLR
jgi:gliding motility-associated-like protein